MPNTHTHVRSSPTRKPTPKPTKGRGPTEPKPKPTKKPRPVHPGQPTRPNHADPSDPPPLDRTRTGIRNRNPDKEPESESDQPGPTDARLHPRPTTHLHPRRKHTPTPTFEQLPVQNPNDIPARTQDPQPSQDPSPGVTRPWNSERPSPSQPTQEQPSHQASNLCPLAQAPRKHRMQPPDATPKSHQSPILVGAKAPGTRPPSDPSPGTPQMPQTQTPPRIHHNAPQDEAKSAPPPLRDGAD
ncbi:proteoglycan 4-like [Girardinichthys multiradiatus]|uniref:proteoglycan 4-like n=1 Tax=Girardinichthys multiradiatus TaxID=208333 RepID=UPI001FADEB49|nr:proteoglycan 4-like [Girardinichthys multiradiatus]